MAISSALGSSALVLAGNGFRNLLTNGAIQVSQRGTTQAGISTDAQRYYTADRYATTILGTAGTWTQSVATTANDYPSESGFRQSLKMTCTTATTPLGATAACFVNQRIEGQNLQAIRKGTASAQTLTLSFWVKSGVIGTYIASLYDHPNGRQIARDYTINVADTWEYKTLVFPPDATGAFNNNSSVGLQVSWFLAAGSNYTSGTLQTSWGAYVGANECVGQVNVAAGNNSAVNYWQMTGAQLSIGSVAVPFEFKSYADDLRECQRYYYLHATGVGVPIVNGCYYQSSTFFGMLHFPTTMRIPPSLSASSGAGNYRIFRQGAPESVSTLQLQSFTENSYTFYISGLSSTAGDGGWLETALLSSTFVSFQAEL